MDIWSLQIPVPLALAVVATLGYLFGRRANHSLDKSSARSESELRRAKTIACELEKITLDVRKSLARHHASVIKFKNRLDSLARQEQEVEWNDLCREADEMLNPTLRLATQLAGAYDDIRRQSSSLMTFTESSGNPVTADGKPKGLGEAVNSQLAIMIRYRSNFSLAVFDIDNFAAFNEKHGRRRGDRVVRQLADILKQSVRETDIVTRHDGEKFFIIMPQTDLHKSAAFSDRLRAAVENSLPVTVSGGVTQAIDGDTARTLPRRAEAALYSAKSAGRNVVFSHDGQRTEQVVEERPAMV